MFYFLHDLASQLGDPWSDLLSGLRVFRYVTFRAMCGAGTAFFITLFIGPRLINWLHAKDWGQNVRDDDALKHHRHKQGTPTMGGLMILLSTTVACLLWVKTDNAQVWVTVATMLLMGAIGFYDDWLKIARGNHKGLDTKGKLLLQSAWMVAVFFILKANPGTTEVLSRLYVPFFKDPVIMDMGWFTPVFMFFVLVGCANAVNLTDGMDGLAIGCVNAAFSAYFVMAYAVSHTLYSSYLQVPYIAGTEEIAVFCGCLIGAGTGFLWFNCHPARVFMGDTGSLALGGALAMVAILTKQEITLIIVGGIFVAEAVSVILQVGSYKLRGGKRIFRCAPIHHHFEIITKERAEQAGMSQDAIENRVVVRFWIVAILFAMLGLATLKLR